MIRSALLCIALAWLWACQASEARPRELGSRVDIPLEGDTMGSTWHIKLSLPEGLRAAALQMQPQIEATLERINDEMSTYRPTSELSRFNQQRTTAMVKLSPELAKVMERALQVGVATEGAYDVTLDPLIDLWGFDRSGRKTEPPTQAQIAEARKHTGLQKVALEGRRFAKLDPEVQVNLGGIAAGFAVDVVCAQLAAAGFTDYMVEITGEVRARGTNAKGQPWHIGIQVPDHDAGALDVLATVPLQNKALTTSGSYQNFFLGTDGKRYSHVLDPRTGAPVQTDLVSVTVLYDDALTADAFDTAFLIIGEERARKIIKDFPGMAAYFIHQDADGKLRSTMTEGFPLVTPPPAATGG